MSLKKWGILFLVVVFSLVLVVGCDGETDDEDATNGSGDEIADDTTAEGDYRDGVYTAVSQFSRGYVEATVNISNDEITDVSFVEYTDLGVEKIYEDYHQRFPMLEEAHDTLAAEMVNNNSWDVDVVTGATSTSNKAMEAVKFALEKASTDARDATYFDGTFFGMSAVGERGWGIAHVTIENDEIVDVKLEETTAASDEDGEAVYDAVDRQVFELKDEDYGWDAYHEAQDIIAERILEAKSPQVDTYTEATGSSNMWMEAVEDALNKARI